MTSSIVHVPVLHSDIAEIGAPKLPVVRGVIIEERFSELRIKLLKIKSSI